MYEDLHDGDFDDPTDSAYDPIHTGAESHTSGSGEDSDRHDDTHGEGDRR